jgi:hypothetical protein
MHDLDKVLIRIRTGSSGQRYLAIEGQKNGVNLWFTFNFEDFERLISSWDDAASDMVHTVKKYGPDHWAFFDLNMPVTYGRPLEMKIQLWVISMPVQVSRALARYAKMIYRRQKIAKSDDSHVMELTAARRVHWGDLYGQGKGSIEVQLDERVKPLVESSFADGGEHGSLSCALERLRVITRNGTRNKWDVGKLCLQPDGRGLYFTVMSPTGQPTLHGGVINHGSDSEPDWSIHT